MPFNLSVMFSRCYSGLTKLIKTQERLTNFIVELPYQISPEPVISLGYEE
jgi:hypothetical protein